MGDYKEISLNLIREVISMGISDTPDLIKEITKLGQENKTKFIEEFGRVIKPLMGSYVYSSLLYIGLEAFFGEDFLYSKSSLEEKLADLIREKPYEKENGHYTYIPYSNKSFVEVITKFNPYRGRSFIDVGSGNGEKLVIARYFLGFSKVTGVEFTEEYHKMAEKRLKFTDINLINGDAKLQDYSSYGLIYLYCPIYKDEGMFELYSQILRTMGKNNMMLEVLPRGGLDEAIEKFEIERKYKEFRGPIVIFRDWSGKLKAKNGDSDEY